MKFDFNKIDFIISVPTDRCKFHKGAPNLVIDDDDKTHKAHTICLGCLFESILELEGREVGDE